jgi:hypothetical protein
VSGATGRVTQPSRAKYFTLAPQQLELGTAEHPYILLANAKVEGIKIAIVVTGAKFKMVVSNAGGILQETLEFNGAKELLAEFAIPEEWKEEAREEPVLAWKTGVAYEFGEVVKNGGVVYQCIKSMTTGEPHEPPNATYWEALPTLYPIGATVQFGGIYYRAIKAMNVGEDTKPPNATFWTPFTLPYVYLTEGGEYQTEKSTKLEAKGATALKTPTNIIFHNASKDTFITQMINYEVGGSVTVGRTAQLATATSNEGEESLTGETAIGASVVKLTGAKEKGFTIGRIVIFGKGTASSTGINAGVPYWIVGEETNGFEVSLTKGGTAIKVKGAAFGTSARVLLLPTFKRPGSGEEPLTDFRVPAAYYLVLMLDKASLAGEAITQPA